MKAIGVILATVAFGFVAFQNCQQSPHPNEINSDHDVDAKAGSIDLRGEKISQVSFSFQEDETVTRNSGSYVVHVNKNMVVALPSGHVSVTSDLDNTGKAYCLTETLTNELIGILKSAKICKNEEKPAEGKVCAQVYKMPYASVITEKATYELGSATDGCGSNSADLCGEHAAILKGFYESVKANYKSFTCPL